MKKLALLLALCLFVQCLGLTALAEDDQVVVAEQIVEEVPVVEEAPAVVEVPAVEEAPAVVEVPAVEEAPAVVEVPAVEEAPAAKEVPAIEEAPAAKEVPAIEEAPVVGDIPADQGAAKTADLPATEEALTEQGEPSTEEATVSEDQANEDEIAIEAAMSPENPVAPEDVTLGLNTERAFYLEGDFVQKVYITLSSPGFLNVLTTFENSTSNEAQLTVRFVNHDMTTTYLSKTISKTSHQAELGDWFDAGTYVVLLSIIRDNGGQVWPISYKIKTAFASEDATASNGDVDHAATLSIDNAYHAGLLTRTRNESWWKVTLTQAGRLEIGVRAHVPNVEAYVVEMRNGQRTRRYMSMDVIGGTNEKAAFNTTEDWFEAGDYYVCINALDKKTGKYSVMASFAPANNQESNNDGSFMTANVLSPDGTAIRGLLSVTDEIDMYTFRLTDTINMQIEADAYMNALNVKLFNGTTRVQMADLSDYATDGTKEKPHIHKGIYRLTPGDYTVIISRDPTTGPRGIYVISATPTITIKQVIVDSYVLNEGQSITGRLSITGGTPQMYYFHLQKYNPATGAFENADHIQTRNNSFSFKPEAGSYRICAQVSDGIRLAEYYSDTILIKDPTAPVVDAMDISPNPTTVGKATTFTPVVHNATSVIRSYYTVYTLTDNIVATFETSGTTPGVWVPNAAGTYKAMVTVTDGTNWASGWADSNLVVDPAPALTITAIETTRNSPLAKNQAQTFTVKVENGTPTAYIYEIYYNNNFQARYSSTSNTFTYRPNAVGDYKLMAVVTDGKQWASAWSDIIHVYDTVPLSFTITPDKTSVPVNGRVNFTLKYSSQKAVIFTEYQLWNAGTNTIIDKWSGNSSTHSFGFATAGTYRVMAVISDGTNWKSAWSPDITVAAPPAITLTTVTANKTSAFVGEYVTYTTSHSTGDPTQYIYNIYKDGSLIKKVTSSSNVFKYQYLDPGTYKIMVVATDGTNWTSIWGPVVTITVPTTLQITDIDVEGGTSKVYYQPFTVIPTIQGDREITQIYYEVYDDANNLVAKKNGKLGSYTYTPGITNPLPASFKVMVVATNGVEWTSKFSPVITYSKPAALTISSVDDNTDISKTIELGQSVEFTGVTVDGAALRQTQYHVFYDDGSGFELLERVDGNSKSYVFIPNKKGDYKVMFVAYDGITWASKFSEVITVE